MRINFKKLSFAALALLGLQAQAAQKPVILTGPEEYQLLSFSPNGVWACGVYNDYNYLNRGFRWNLLSGEIELLSTLDESTAWDIADDGTVSGTATDRSTTSNHAPTELPAFYRNGKWTSVELPAGATPQGLGYGISSDGHYMTGSVNIGGKYKAYIWKDGKVYRALESLSDAMPYAIAPDGQTAAGWAYRSNRSVTYWDAEGKPIYLSDYQSPWSSAREFSTDGKKLLIWGGWADTDDLQLMATYDLQTKEVGYVPTIDPNPMMGLDLFGISNDGIIVGEENQTRAYIYADGKAQLAYDYLQGKGVDFSGIDFLVMEGDTLPMLFRAQAVSGDGKTFGLLYYDSEGTMRSMVVMLDRDWEHTAPVGVVASKLPRLDMVRLSWSAPVGATGLKGYNIYRNGIKLNEELLAGCKYYDALEENGEYSYVVSAVAADDVETKADEVTLTLADETAEAPRSLTARQKGVTGVQMQWLTPKSNLVCMGYGIEEDGNLTGFGVNTDNMTFETAIRFDKEEMEQYDDFQLKQVTFYPMSKQQDWKLNVYTYDENNALKCIYTQDIVQELKYNEKNTVVLDNPVGVPAGDLIVAIQVSVPTANLSVIGMDNGRLNPNGDLLRLIEEEDFYSLYALSSVSGYPSYQTWMMEAIFMPADDLPELGNIDDISTYVVYADGVEVGRTSDNSFQLDKVSAGEHVMGVKAVYANGMESDVTEASVTIAPDYKKVSVVNVAAVGASGILASWNTPADDDLTQISYATGYAATSANTGVTGPEENNYGFMAAAKYSSSMFLGYQGYKVNSFRFYPTTDASFTFLFYENNTLIYEQEITDYTLNKWNEVALETPVYVKPNAEYMLVLDCYDVTPYESPLAVDNQLPFSYTSDLYSTDNGESWSSIADAAIYGNWMLGLTVADQNATPVEVSGYNVRIDNVQRNAALITDNQYSYEFEKEDALAHRINVDVVYPGATGDVLGTTNYFYIGTAGIDNATVNRFNLEKGDNVLIVRGEGVRSVMLFAADGKLIRKASGSSIALDGLADGLYIAKIKTTTGNSSTKIQIAR